MGGSLEVGSLLESLLSPEGSEPEGWELREELDEDSLALDSEDEGGALDSLELTGGGGIGSDEEDSEEDSLDSEEDSLADETDGSDEELEEELLLDELDELLLDEGGAEEDGPGHQPEELPGVPLLLDESCSSGSSFLAEEEEEELSKPHSGSSLSSDEEELLSPGSSAWM